MDKNKLIDLIELHNEYAIALMDYYINKGVNIKKLQQYTDEQCDAWAKTFIAIYHNEFKDRQIQIAVFRYLDSLGVKQGHTGKRFSEALYKQLHYIFLDNQNKKELSK